MSVINDLLNFIFVELFQGERLLSIVDEYYIYQEEYKQILMIIGVGSLAAFGLISIVKSILKLASNIVKILLILGITYYLLDVVLGISVWGFIFS